MNHPRSHSEAAPIEAVLESDLRWVHNAGSKGGGSQCCTPFLNCNARRGELALQPTPNQWRGGRHRPPPSSSMSRAFDTLPPSGTPLFLGNTNQECRGERLILKTRREPMLYALAFFKDKHSNSSLHTFTLFSKGLLTKYWLYFSSLPLFFFLLFSPILLLLGPPATI